jgi:hypothetical protein
MPRGDKSSYTNKQKRKAEHIEEGYEHRGRSGKGGRATRVGDREQGDARRKEERLRTRDGRRSFAVPQGRPARRGCRGQAPASERPRPTDIISKERDAG